MSPTEPRLNGALRGRVIALPESRELDRLAELLEAEGAETVRCPMLQMLDAPDREAVNRWLAQLAAAEFDDLVFLTGEGLRRLLARAEELGTREAVIAGLRRARKITRGPKPARVLHEVGLSAEHPAPVPTSAGVRELLATLDLRGRNVGLQLYGEEPSLELIAAIEGAGATVSTVAPYVYAAESDERQVAAVIEGLDRGTIHAIAFTSAGQTDRLWQVAKSRELNEALNRGLTRACVAAIGPVAAESLTSRGARVDVMPERPFVMKRLIAALVGALGVR